MKKAFLYFIVFIITGFTSSLFAQSVSPTRIDKPVHFDKSKPLRDIEPIRNRDGDMSWKKKEIVNKIQYSSAADNVHVSKSKIVISPLISMFVQSLIGSSQGDNIKKWAHIEIGAIRSLQIK